MKRKVITYHLEMTGPGDLRPSAGNNSGLKIEKVGIPCPEINRFFYTAVGGDWYWIDRLRWDYDRWADYVNRPELETWIVYLEGTPAGYFELEMQAGANVEIVYFGLIRQFSGQGIGGEMLTRAVERAWAMGAKRVWVHTCSLDGPTALANYKARGFRQFKEETADADLPDDPPGPWPGAKSQ